MNELSPELKKLLEAARESYSPDDARVAAVRESLAAKVAMPTASVSTAPASSGGIAPALRGGAMSESASAAISAGAPWVKPVAGLLIAALGAGGLWLGMRAADSGIAPALRGGAMAVPASPPAPQPTMQPAAPPPALPAASPASVVREPQVAVDSTQPVAPPARRAGRDAQPAPAARANASAAPMRAASERRARGTRSPVRGPAGAPIVAPTPIAPPADGPADAPAALPTETAPAAEDVARTEEPLVAPADDSLVGELALVRRARAALARAQPAEALALSQQHARRYPRGTLRQERLATQVLALCALQRTEEARVQARELERVAPRSPHLMRLRASCVTQGGFGEEK